MPFMNLDPYKHKSASFDILFYYFGHSLSLLCAISTMSQQHKQANRFRCGNGNTADSTFSPPQVMHM